MAQKYWTMPELSELTRRYATERTDVLAEHFGRSVSSVLKCAEKLGLRKAPGYNYYIKTGIWPNAQHYQPLSTKWIIKMNEEQKRKLKSKGGARAVRDWLDSLP
jgi:hypothetical protein